MTASTPARTPAGLSPRARRAWLTAHIATSVGWLGGAYTMLVLGITAARSDQAGYRSTVYDVMRVFDRAVNIPLALGMLTTGLVISLRGKWGLVRHRWVTVKLVLSLTVPIATLWLSVPRVASLQVTLPTDPAAGRTAAEVVAISVASTLTLTVVTAISVFKPWGRTRRGRGTRARRGLPVPSDAGRGLTCWHGPSGDRPRAG